MILQLARETTPLFTELCNAYSCIHGY